MKEVLILFIKRSIGAIVGMSLLSVLIFTLTTNVVLETATVWAETTEQAAQPAESSGGFFSGIMNWVTGVTDAVNKMWGMENGSGVAMVVNGLFYLLLVVGTLFIGKMVFNIFNDLINRKVDTKYEKPSFRKK